MKNFREFLNESESHDDIRFYLQTSNLNSKVILAGFLNNCFVGYANESDPSYISYWDIHGSMFINRNKNLDLTFASNNFDKNIQRYMEAVKKYALERYDSKNSERAKSENGLSHREIWFEYMRDCFLGREKIPDSILKNLRVGSIANDFGIGESKITSEDSTTTRLKTQDGTMIIVYTDPGVSITVKKGKNSTIYNWFRLDKDSNFITNKPNEYEVIKKLIEVEHYIESARSKQPFNRIKSVHSFDKLSKNIIFKAWYDSAKAKYRGKLASEKFNI